MKHHPLDSGIFQTYQGSYDILEVLHTSQKHQVDTSQAVILGEEMKIGQMQKMLSFYKNVAL